MLEALCLFIYNYFVHLDKGLWTLPANVFKFCAKHMQALSISDVC